MEDLYLVNKAFYASYGKSLIRLLQKETTGNFEKVLCGNFMGRYKYWATMIGEAIIGCGTDERMLIELVLMGDENDWAAIKQEYFLQFKTDVVEAISDDIAKNADWSRLVRAWIC